MVWLPEMLGHHPHRLPSFTLLLTVSVLHCTSFAVVQCEGRYGNQHAMGDHCQIGRSCLILFTVKFAPKEEFTQDISNLFSTEGKVAVVAGGGSGLGRAMAEGWDHNDSDSVEMALCMSKLLTSGLYPMKIRVKTVVVRSACRMCALQWRPLLATHFCPA